MNYKNTFAEIIKLGVTKRGFEFEKLINKICEDQGILLSNSYKTADTEQQIDGAVEINSKIFLIEAKWEVSSTLAASKLFSFLGKINSKIEGTSGVFISYNELKDNFISSVRNGLKQTCIIIHGKENILDIITGKVNIKDFIWYTYQQASMKNRSFVNTYEYLSIPRKDTIGNIADVTSKWDEISKLLLDSSLPDIFSVTLEGLYNKNIELSKKVLNVYLIAQTDKLRQEKYFILINKCLDEEKEIFQTQLLIKLKSEHWNDFSGYSFLEILKDRIEIEETDKEIILNKVMSHLEKHLGSYNDENDASAIIYFLFNKLTDEDFEKLANLFLIIYCDTFRQDRFLQKQIAKKVFERIKKIGSSLYEVIKPTILDQLKQMKADEYLFKFENDDMENIKKNTINRLKNKFNTIFKEINNYENLLFEEYDKI